MNREELNLKWNPWVEERENLKLIPNWCFWEVAEENKIQCSVFTKRSNPIWLGKRRASMLLHQIFLYHMWKREKFHESDMREFLCFPKQCKLTQIRSWRTWLTYACFSPNNNDTLFFYIPFGVVYVGRVTTMGQQILILSPSKFEWEEEGKKICKGWPNGVKFLSSCTHKILL
jgi:hypothetical protein